MFNPTHPFETKRLIALRQLNVLDTPTDANLDAVVQCLMRRCGTPMAALTLVDEHREWFKCSFGLEREETEREAAFCAHTIVEPSLLLVPDATCDVRFANNRLVTGEPHIKFYAGAPIYATVGKGRFAIGALCVMDTKPGQLSAANKSFLLSLAALVSAMLTAPTLGLRASDLMDNVLEPMLLVAQVQGQSPMVSNPAAHALNLIFGAQKRAIGLADVLCLDAGTAEASLFKRALKYSTFSHNSLRYKNTFGALIACEALLFPIQAPEPVFAVLICPTAAFALDTYFQNMTVADRDMLLSLNADKFWVTDAELRLTEVVGTPYAPGDHARALRVLGKRPWEWPYVNLAHTATFDDVRNAWQAQVAFRNVEYEVLDPLRSYWLSTSGYPIFDTAGLLLGYRGTSRDITGQKLRQLALAQSEKKVEELSTLLHHVEERANIGGWSLDLQTGLVTWTDQVFRIFDFPIGPMPEFDAVMQLFSAQSRVVLQDALDRGRNDGTAYDLSLSCVTSKGRPIWVRAKGSAVWDGPRLVALQGSIQDTTSYVLARLAVQEQQRLLQTCLDQMHPGIAILSRRGVIFSNASLKMMLGYSAAEFEKANDYQRILGPAFMRGKHAKTIRQSGHLPPTLISLKRQDGTMVSTLGSLSTIVWQGRKHLLASVTPVLEADKLALEMRAARDRSEQLMVHELKRQQANIAAELHDSMGSHLAAVLMLLAALQTDNQTSGHLLTQALEQTRLAAKMTRELAHGLMPIDGAPTSFWRALERFCVSTTETGAAHCTFSKRGNFDHVPVEVANHLYRIAQEATRNAIRHGKATQVDITLEDAIGAPGLCALTVTDNGIGFDINPESDGDLESANPDNSRSATQSGLGLRLMRARAREIDASIGFTASDLGGVHVCVQWFEAPPANPSPEI